MPNATNTQQLVTLPKDVATAIESLLEKRVNKFGIIIGLEADEDSFHYPEFTVLNKYFDNLDESNERHPFALMSALVNGYQVEPTAEEIEAERKEKVREFYVHANLDRSTVHDNVSASYYGGTVNGIRQTLNLLGITIAGINAPAEGGEA